MRYLVKLNVRLGDTAIDCALLNAIARLDEDCHIEVLSQHGISSLLKETPFIDKIHVRTGSGLTGIRHQLGLLHNNWDVVLVTRYAPRLQIFYHLAKARHKRCWRHFISKDSVHHMVARVSMLDGILDGWEDPIDPTIHFNSNRINSVNCRYGIEKSYRNLAVGPGASYDAKRWDEKKFIELCNNVSNGFDNIYVLGSRSETEICSFVADRIGGINLAGKLELLDICALLSCVTLYIGNDSGLGHLSASVGTNTVAIGDTVGLVCAPWNQHMVTGDPKKIVANEVLVFLKDNQLV